MEMHYTEIIQQVEGFVDVKDSQYTNDQDFAHYTSRLGTTSLDKNQLRLKSNFSFSQYQ